MHLWLCERVCLRTRAGAHACRKYELSELLAADAPCFCFASLTDRERNIADSEDAETEVEEDENEDEHEGRKRGEERSTMSRNDGSSCPKGSIFWRFEKGETTMQDGRRTTDRGWLEVKKKGWAVMK